MSSVHVAAEPLGDGGIFERIHTEHATIPEFGLRSGQNLAHVEKRWNFESVFTLYRASSGALLTFLCKRSFESTHQTLPVHERILIVGLHMSAEDERLGCLGDMVRYLSCCRGWWGCWSVPFQGGDTLP